MKSLYELIAEYPIFQGTPCGVSVRSGWVPLLEDLAKDLADVQGLQVLQVKQKFGGLRVYVDSEDPRVFEAVARVEERALRTCEACSGGDDVKTSFDKGRVQTLCKLCRTSDEG